MQALHLSVFAIVSHCILSVCSHGSIGALIDKVDRIDDDLLNLQLDVPRLKEEFRNEVDVLKLSLRADLLNNMVPEYMEKQVKAYIVQTLRSQSLGELLNSQIGTEVGQLKQELHQLRSKYHRVTKTFRTFEEQRAVMRDGLMKKNTELEKHVEKLEEISEETNIRLQDMESENSQIKSSVKVMNETISGRVRILERELREDGLRIQYFQSENSLLKNSLEMMNESLNTELESECGCAYHENKTVAVRVGTLERELDDARKQRENLKYENIRINSTLDRIHTILSEGEEIKHDLSVENQNGSKVSFPSKSVNTTLQLIQEQKTRLLLVPRYTTDKQFKQLNIHGNTLQNYKYFQITNVVAVAYDPKSRTLIIGRYAPNEIYSSPLDTSSLTLLRKGIASYGMAVDEMRQILFMTTYQPRYTISRMTTDGKLFRPIVDLDDYGSPPRAITVDPRHRRVYATVFNKLVSVDYNGLNLRTLATGDYMRSIALDHTNNILYYNDGKMVMRRSLDENTTTQVTELGYYPHMYQFYNDTLYMTHGNNVDAVYFVHKSNILSQLKSLDKIHLLCLVPDSHN